MRRLLLAIDTAGSRCAVAVFDMMSGEISAQAAPDIGRGHAELLMDLVTEVLAVSGAGYDEIEKIAVSVGPGSFTGLRVGVAAATGLALALGVPAVGVTTLEALAEPYREGQTTVLAVIDAKRGELYAALFGGKGEVLRPPQAIRPEGLMDFVAAAGSRAVSVVGSGADIAFGVLGTDRLQRADQDAGRQIASVARIGAERPVGDPVKPVYLRGADAKPQGASGISLMQTPATLP